MEGYIKLHRQVIKWEWYDDANTFRLFIHLLLKANYADGNWRGIFIKRSQTFTSISNLAHDLKLSDKAIRVAIDKLVNTKEIICKGANNGTMVTVCKYDDYQLYEDNKGQAKRKTKGKEGATNNKNNNKEEIVNNNLLSWRDDFEIYKTQLRNAYNELIKNNDWISKCEKYNPNVNILLTIEKACVNYWATEAGWKKKKSTKTIDIDWESTLTNAISQPTNRVYLEKQKFGEPKQQTNIFRTTD